MSQAERKRGSESVRRGGARAIRRLVARDTDERGAAAAEFALVLPVLLAFVMGIIEFGWLYFVENEISYAVRSVSRDVSVGTYDVTQAELEVETRLSHFGFPSLDAIVCPPANAACPATGANEVSIVVTVPMAEAALIDFLGLFSSGSIDVAVTMALEP